jgi:hypothetical protein
VADVVEKRPAEPIAPLGARRAGAYSGRFALAHFLVILVFAGMLGLFAYLAFRSEPADAWSSFKPKGGETYPRAQSVANYVAPGYVSNGAPIAVVQAQPLIYQNAVVDGIAFTRAPFQDVGTHYTQFQSATKTLLYVFCGQATRCGLAESNAEAVIPLLRRESLELALYTFKYFPDIDAVVTLLPPATNSSPAVYLRRSNLKAELSRPLEQTLPRHDVVTTSSLTIAELRTIERLTANSLFPSSFQQSPNGRTLLLLGTGNQEAPSGG